MKHLNMNYFHSRRFKFGSLATVITAVFIAALILINVVAGLLLNRFPVTIDLTSDKRFELTQDSLDFLKGIDEDVTITALADESEFESGGIYFKQIYEIIKAYGKHSGRISIEFKSYSKNPGIADKYPSEKFAQGDIIVETGKRYKKIDNGSLISVSQSSYGETKYGSQAEQQITSALMYVTEANITKVAMLSGLASAADVSGLKDLLASNVYDVTSVNLMTEELSDEYSVAILAQPQADLTTEQAKKLSDFLDNDGKYGKALLFVGSGQAPGAVLKNFLADWGIEMQGGFVCEMDQKNIYNQQTGGLVFGASVADEDINAKLSNKGLPVVAAYATPITTLFDTKDNRQTRVLLKSADTSILIPADADAETFDPSKQDQTAMNLVVQGNKMRSGDNGFVSSSVIAFGSAEMMNSTALTYGGYGNGDFVVTAVNDVCGKDSVVKILPIDLSYSAITISQTQVTTNAIIFIGIIPLLILAVGVVVFVRRRHL